MYLLKVSGICGMLHGIESRIGTKFMRIGVYGIDECFSENKVQRELGKEWRVNHLLVFGVSRYRRYR
jgi:hypothetical protein